MALIVLQVPLIFTTSCCEFYQVNCLDLITNDEWPTIYLTSVHWIITFGGNAGVLSQAITKPKTVLSLKMHFVSFGLLYQRKPLTML